MKNKKSLLLTSLLLAFVMVFTTAIFAACAKKKTHTITWEYVKEEVTVTADGYETLPTELEAGVNVPLTITPATGYEILKVTGATKSGGKYSVTMGSANITVTVTMTRILKDVTVTNNAESRQYFADQTVDTSKLVVTAQYEVGEDVTVPDDKYKITYYHPVLNDKGEPVLGEDGNPQEELDDKCFAQGDTKFAVTFGNITKTITLKKAVAGDLAAIESAALIVEGGKPGLTVTGSFNELYEETDAAAAKAAIEKFINDCSERNSWAHIAFTKDATVDLSKMTFTMKLIITGEIRTGYQYYFHVGSGADGRNLGDMLTADHPTVCEVEATMDPGDSNDLPFKVTYSGEPVMGTDGQEFFIGKCMDWGGCVMIMVTTEAERNALALKTVYDVNLKVDNMTNPTKAYYVLTAAFEHATAEKIASIQFGNQPDSLYFSQGKTADVVNADKGVYRLWFDVTEYAGGEGSMLWANLYAGEDHVSVGSIKLTDHSVNGQYCVVGESKYSLFHNNYTQSTDPETPVYSMPNLTKVAKTDETNPETADPSKITDPEIPEDPSEDATYEVTDVTLEKGEGSVVYYVISGTYENYTVEQVQQAMKSIYFDFQFNSAPWTAFDSLARTVSAADGAFTVKIDVSTLAAHKYTTHINDKSSNFKLEKAEINGRTVTVGTKTYTLINAPTAGSNADLCYGTVGLEVVNTAEPSATYDFTKTNLVVEGGKVYLTIEGTCENCTEESFIMDLQNDSTWKYLPGGDDTKGAGVCTVKIEGGKYTAKLDITDAPAAEYLAHIYLGGAATGTTTDFEIKGGASFTKVTVTNAGKTYTLETKEMWERQMLTITVAEA